MNMTNTRRETITKTEAFNLRAGDSIQLGGVWRRVESVETFVGEVVVDYYTPCERGLQQMAFGVGRIVYAILRD